jgi:hypothetical protein
MNCLEFQDQWQRRLDGEPAPESSALEHHASQCAACRVWASAARRLEDTLPLLPLPFPAPCLGERIHRAVMAQWQARRRWRRRFQVASALAAALLAAAFLGYRGLEAPSNSTEAPSPGPLAPNEPQRLPTLPVTSVNQKAGEVGSALVALVNRTADETVGQGRILLPVVTAASGLPETGPWPQPLEPSVSSLREAGQGVSTGLEPVASSARRAVSLFLGEMPGEVKNQKSKVKS